MKIKAINIASFGGLKNKQINLNDGFNIIYGDNENGKTTIMNFIKMMFYGSERGSSQISKNVRKKYTPWDNSTMAGSIDFETDGKEYRIERIFGSSNSTDKVTLIDLGLGKRESVAADIGLKLFGLSCPAFERSVFVGQFGFPTGDSIAEGEINSKLSNLTLTGDQSVSFDEVNKRLADAKNNLTTKRSVGIYDKNIALYRDLTQKAENARLMQQALDSKQQSVQDVKALIENLKSTCEGLKKIIDSEQDFKNAEKLKELLSLKEKLDSLNQTLKLENGKLVDEMFLRKIEFCLSKIESINQKLDAKQNEIKLIEGNLNLALNPSPDVTPQKAEELKAKIEGLEQDQIQNTQSLEELKNVKSSNNLALIGILVIGISLMGLGAFLGIIPIICGAALTVASIILQVSNKAKTNANEKKLLDLKLKQNELISLIATEKANLNAVNTALNSNSSFIENQKQMLKECQEELSALSQEKQSNTDTLFEAYSPFKATYSIQEITSSLEEIRKKASEQKEIKQNINYILKDVGNISYQEAADKLEQLKAPDTETDFDALKAQYEQAIQEQNRQTSVYATLNAEIKAIKESAANIEAINSKLSSLQETIKNQKEYCDALDIASSVLADSFVEVRRSFGSVLEKKASDIFKGITSGKYQNMSISKSFEIAVEKSDQFGSKEIDYLSSGTTDQAYLALRLAVCELMAQGKDRLPILLDDALAQYDDKRTEIALDFLKEYSKQGQIVLFTCHNSIVGLAKQKNIVKTDLQQ